MPEATRPGVLHLGPGLDADLAAALERGAHEPGVRAVVLHLDATSQLPTDVDGRALLARCVRAVLAGDVPVVAHLAERVGTAACALALVSDAVVADRSTSLQLGGPARGGISLTLPAAVGRLRARRLLLLGEPVTAVSAADWGVVTHLVPSGSTATARVGTVLDSLLAHDPLTLTGSRRALDAPLVADLEDALAREDRTAALLARHSPSA
ncbi:enoyl-CoA hydratase/isomerase family protein [Nocardioides bruguierae]|uniref:enoyl-CoA hydratase/isomerase family protein n=1 Tax=Nocardioides bruguierae TaxID=2945102 RepID=UPI0020203583|nr:enoyl-CoA hydratase-related protein [Nocardioides bruguierae]MCL8025611.1 enoyl-CoA hydratase-related protein [Nocardioides bruguierae]